MEIVHGEKSRIDELTRLNIYRRITKSNGRYLFDSQLSDMKKTDRTIRLIRLLNETKAYLNSTISAVTKHFVVATIPKKLEYLKLTVVLAKVCPSFNS